MPARWSAGSPRGRRSCGKPPPPWVGARAAQSPGPGHPGGAGLGPSPERRSRDRHPERRRRHHHGADVQRVARRIRPRWGRRSRLRGVRRSMARSMARAHAEVAPRDALRRCRHRGLGTGRGRDAPADPRSRRRLPRRARAQRLVRRAQPRARGCSRRSTSGSPSIPRTACSCPCCATSATAIAADLRRGLDAMKARCGARKCRPRSCAGQTITLSNFGTFAGRYADPSSCHRPSRSSAPADRARPWSLSMASPPCTASLPLSLTFDHRAATGGEAARFLAAVKRDARRRPVTRPSPDHWQEAAQRSHVVT